MRLDVVGEALKKWLRSLLLFLLVVIVFLVVVVASYIYFWHFDLERKYGEKVLDLNPPDSFMLLGADGKELAELPAVVEWDRRLPQYRNRVFFRGIPKPMVDAIIAAEDERFFEHDGIDKLAIARAGAKIIWDSFWESVFVLRPKLVIPGGASTLTQQGVRLTFLQDDLEKQFRGQANFTDKISRKIEEARISVWLEDKLEEKLGNKRAAKEKIFELYANLSYCGHGRYGVASCEKFYFNKKLKDITHDEAAMIAGLIAGPGRFSPINNVEVAKARRNEVLYRMAKEGFLASEKASAYAKEPIRLNIRRHDLSAAAVINHSLKTVFDKEKIFWKNGWAVRTTVGRDFQLYAEEALEHGLNLYRGRYPEQKDKIQGAFVVLNNSDGAILAEVGGSSYTRYVSFNRATEAKRQPGSASKPFVYTAALEADWKMSCLDPGIGGCMVLDAPVRVPMGYRKPSHWIGNYDGKSKGWIELWQALSESRNQATVWLGKRVSPEKLVELMVVMGLNSDIEAYPTTAIGAEEVTPLELVAAYVAFANGGWKVTPHIVESVVNENGKEVYRAPRYERVQVLSEDVARGIAEGLRHTIVWRSGTARRLASINLPLICKTGTTNDFRDAWIVCSVYGENGITAAAWIGFDDNTTLGKPDLCKPLDPIGSISRESCEPGGKTALPVFEYFIKKVQPTYANSPEFPFEEEVLRAEGRK